MYYTLVISSGFGTPLVAVSKDFQDILDALKETQAEFPESNFEIKYEMLC